MIVNPNGVVITPSGTVNTRSFTASTLNIKDEDFINEKYNFEGNGTSKGVKNAGKITIGGRGHAALLGGYVSNSGIVSAKLGKIALGAGEKITLDFVGDGLMTVSVPIRKLGLIRDINGNTLQSLVSNSGFLKANGMREDYYDKLLLQLFPNLCEETYSHSRPSKKHLKSLLLMADNFELRRYKHRHTQKAHVSELVINEKFNKIIDLFYSSVRPALEYIYTNKNFPFIISDNSKLPQSSSDLKTDMLPFDLIHHNIVQITALSEFNNNVKNWVYIYNTLEVNIDYINNIINESHFIVSKDTVNSLNSLTKLFISKLFALQL